MTIEALLERIAVALEKSNELRHAQILQVANSPVGLRDYQKAAIDEELNEPDEERKTHKIAGGKEGSETKPEKKSEKEKPKYDFNKEVRGPYVDLLQNVAKSRLGPKETTKLARKLLKEFTGQIEEVLSIKTLPEDKYEDFVAAVKDYKSQILNDNYKPIED